MHAVDGSDDVVDRVEQRGIGRKDLIDERAGPGFGERFGNEAATHPRRSDSTDC